MLGLADFGIEWDEAACATRAAAGHQTIQADVAALDPAEFSCWGFIGSPPCQGFSAAGKGHGRKDTDIILECARLLAEGVDRRSELAPACHDARSLLVTEPVRWVRALRPRWVALEQVPSVLPLWEEFGFHFATWGYSVWTGKVHAEQYGVPQTRQRALLLASLDHEVGEPTHTPSVSQGRGPARGRPSAAAMAEHG